MLAQMVSRRETAQSDQTDGLYWTMSGAWLWKPTGPDAGLNKYGVVCR